MYLGGVMYLLLRQFRHKYIDKKVVDVILLELVCVCRHRYCSFSTYPIGYLP